jgi:hypothetical protein
VLAGSIIDPMPVEVRISDPMLLEELISALLQNGCVAHRSSPDSCRVVQLHAAHDEEALRELVFFLRAWQLTQPAVSAVVIA